MTMGYIKHLPLDAIEHLGQVQTRDLPAVDPFAATHPYALDPADFYTRRDRHDAVLFTDATDANYCECAGESQRCQECFEHAMERNSNEGER